VPQLSGDLAPHLSPFTIEPVEIFVFERDAAGNVSIRRVRLKMVLKEFTPAEVINLHRSSPKKEADAITKVVFGFRLLEWMSFRAHYGPQHLAIRGDAAVTRASNSFFRGQS
jgi:hypothetical protein